MPWTPDQAPKHNHKLRGHPHAQRQWSHVADSVLQKTGDEGLAIREANGVAAKHMNLHDHRKANRGDKRTVRGQFGG